ncbi:E3 ubiquitin-protein ligase rnf13 [Sarracenia purpurea var. burkii]
MAVLANPEDGCQSIASPPNTTGINRTGKWIALMKTGNCNFTVKARNAQNANYQMVLIYGVENFADDEVDIKMHKSSNKSDIKIQASSASDPDNKTAITLHFDKEKIILGIVNDDNDPVYCHRYEDGITQCVGFNSNRLVPIPDTWSV